MPTPTPAPTEYDLPPDAPGPQPTLDLLPLWRFTVGKRDSLLILKALGGRLKEGFETDQAKQLGDRLTLARAHAAREMVQALERAESAVLNPKPAKDTGE